MTDTPLLRLARLTLRLAGDATGSDADSLNLHAALFDLVRDLEAAESMRLRLADSTENEAPARRTITREEFTKATLFVHEKRKDGRMATDELVQLVAGLLRLTVEDA